MPLTQPAAVRLEDLKIPILLLKHRIDQNCLIRLTTTHQVGQSGRFLQNAVGLSRNWSFLTNPKMGGVYSQQYGDVMLINSDSINIYIEIFIVIIYILRK
jgi:hypothetical protein